MNFQRIKALIKKEFLHIKRDPRTIALIFVMPVFQVLIFGYALNFDVDNLATITCDLDKSALSRRYIDGFLASKRFQLVKETNNPAELNDYLDAGKARLAVYVPPGFSKSLKKGEQAPVQILIDGSDPTVGRLAFGYARSITEVFSLNTALSYFKKSGRAAAFREPVEVTQKVYFNPDLKSVNFIIPGLIAIFLVIIPTVLTSVAIVREKEFKTIEQLTVTPLKPHEIIIGKTFPYLVMALINAFLITLIGVTWFRIPLRGSMTLLVLMTLLYVLSTVSIGLLISTIVDSQQVAMMFAMLTTYLPSILLSGFMFPVKNMPLPLRALAFIVPTKYFITILRSIFLKGGGLAEFPFEAAMLSVFAFVFGFFAFLRLKASSG